MKRTKADNWFSIYIRLRDSDDNGICKCVTCNHMGHWRKFDNGHYVKRKHMGARYSEKNCHAQCTNCNWLLQGNDAVYREVIIERYGQQLHDLLKSCERNTYKYTAFEMNLIAKEYEIKAKELALQKVISL